MTKARLNTVTEITPKVTKYADKVPIDDDGDMLYVTEGDTKFQLRAKLFDTEQQAKEHAELWGEQAVVVEILPENTNWF